MNKNNLINFCTVIFLTILAVILLKTRLVENYISVFVCMISIIISSVSYFVIKPFSKLLACSLIFLLFALCFLFGEAVVSEDSADFSAIILIAQAMVIIFTFICETVTKKKTIKKYKNEVGKYLSDKVLDNIETSIKDIGTKSNVTVMFIDIRGFTAISERLSATEVTEVLNDYFKEVVPVITRYNGVVNKFIGDAVLAVFEGETPEEHAKNAVKAGKAISKRLHTFQCARESAGKETFLSGIGINTGDVFIGSIGTEERREYAVIGDTVNLASRTEAANRVYKTQFLITENTYQYVKDIADVIKISDVEMRGKREKINVYEVLMVSETE